MKLRERQSQGGSFMKFKDKLIKNSLSFLGGAVVSVMPEKYFKTQTQADKYMLRGDEKFSLESGNTWTCGFGKSVVTAPDYKTETYYIAGYDSNNPVKDVLDDMYARAVFIDDNKGNGGVVFCAVDCVGMSRKDINDIRKIVIEHQKHKLKSINICATHSHSAIDTQGLWGEKLYKSGRNEKYMAYLKERTAQTIISAIETRKDGKLYFGFSQTDGLQADVRTPVTFDGNLNVLHFVPNDSSGDFYAVNFACHAELLGDKTTRVSADFPAYLIKEIESRKANTNAIFFNGAIGGMVSAKDIKKIYRNEINCEEYTKNYGKMLGELVLAIDNEKELKPILNIKSRGIKIIADNTLLILARFLKILNNDISRTEKRTKATLFSEICYAEFGEKDLALFLVPGELFPELFNGEFLTEKDSANHKKADYDKSLSDMSDCKHKFVIGLANDELGYIVPENDYLLNEVTPYLNSQKDDMQRNHYEETNSVSKDAAKIILDEFEKIAM